MTRECSGKVLTELNPGLSFSREGTVGSWNTIFRSSSFGNLLASLVVRMKVLEHYPRSEWALLDWSLNIPLSNIAQPQDTSINESASYFTVNCLFRSHSNSLPVFCQPRLILLKLMHDPSHLLPHVDIPINIVFEHQSGRNFLVDNPDNAQSAKRVLSIKTFTGENIDLPLHHIHMCAPTPNKSRPTHVRLGYLKREMQCQYMTLL